MPSLGTRKFWIAAPGDKTSQKENQILKNKGYISIQLFAANYMSTGNFWQNIFGGSDKFAISTTLRYQSGTTSIEAVTIQDVWEVDVNEVYQLGHTRPLAVKIPATAESLWVGVKITAVKNDALQAKFDMLKQPEFGAALEMAPLAVGQVLSIASLAKKLFTDSGPQSELDASFAGIISLTPEDNPVSSGKLTKGKIVMISTNEGDSFANAEESKFAFRGDTLYYNNKQVTNTYIVINIDYESLKGGSEDANWFKKYNEALGILDKLYLVEDADEMKKLLKDAKETWIQGNALLDADDSYINEEKRSLKAVAMKSIMDRYEELKPKDIQALPIASGTELLKNLTGSSVLNEIKSSFPATANFISKNGVRDLTKPLSKNTWKTLTGLDEALNKIILQDTDQYLSELKNNNLSFQLNSFKK